MSKSVSIEQSHNVISVLINNVDWSEQDGKVLQEIIRKPRKAGVQFTAFLKNGAKVVIGKPRVIPIDRSKPFNPTEFMGKGWTVVEEDERSLALTEVDLNKICLEACLEKGETQISGREKLKRLKKADHIRLDAKIFQTLWENKLLIPEAWKEKIDNEIRSIFFDGTVLLSDGLHFVLYLRWEDGKWIKCCRYLDYGWSVFNQSAVLSSS